MLVIKNMLNIMMNEKYSLGIYEIYSGKQLLYIGEGGKG
jgi:hypothetical protein